MNHTPPTELLIRYRHVERIMSDKIPPSDLAILIGVIALGVYWFSLYGVHDILHVTLTPDNFTTMITNWELGIGVVLLISGIGWKILKWKIS